MSEILRQEVVTCYFCIEMGWLKSVEMKQEELRMSRYDQQAPYASYWTKEAELRTERFYEE